MRTFESRSEAGRQLGQYILERMTLTRPLVLGMPRGGMIVAQSLAEHVRGDLDVVVTHPVESAPHKEMAVAAAGHESAIVAVYGATAHAPYITVLDVEMHGVDSVEDIRHRSRAIAEAQRRMRGLRRRMPAADVSRRDIIIVGDGLASALPAIAAIRYVRTRGAARVVVAAPVCAQTVIASLSAMAHDVITLATPTMLPNVSRHYRDDHAITDDDVMRALEATQPRTVPRPDVPHR